MILHCSHRNTKLDIIGIFNIRQKHKADVMLAEEMNQER